MEYADYLKSIDWKNKREEKLSRKLGTKKRCAICASEENLNIHHLSYQVDLTKVEQKDLRVLCKRCHSLTHELFKNGKLKFKSKNHHSRFVLTKTAVKKELGISKENMF